MSKSAAARRSRSAAPARAAPRAPARPARKRRRRSRRIPASAVFWRYAGDAAFLLFAAAIAAAAGLAYFARDLPDTDQMWRSERAPTLTLVAADGSPISVHGQSFGAPVRLADLPDHLPKAVLAVEDRNFYHHVGVNPLSIARALAANAQEGEIVQGGSTLTQQLAKNLFLAPDRTMRRKIEEALLAFWLEQRFSKDEILTLYLNRVYFGAGAYGVDAASWRYFGKPAAKTSLPEAAILAALLKAPSRYAPDRNPKDAGARARLVVDAMVAARFITKKEAATAIATPVRIRPPPAAGAPYFVDRAIDEARLASGGVDADLVVRTTLSPALQDALEAGLAAGTALVSLDPSIEVAAVLLDGDGSVRALAGGRDYRRTQFNRATDARRPPGSAFKPFVYLAAVEAGMAPGDLVADAPIAIGAWSPRNFKNRYYGEVSVAEALARSLNGATVRLQEYAGRDNVRRAARRMGMSAPLSRTPALALGVDALSPLDLAGAYAPFANGGWRIDPHTVESVALADGRTLHKAPGPYLDAAASPEAIRAMNAMLAGVVDWGTGRAAALAGAQAYGKTGTTQGSRDAWFAGHAGGLVCVVWVGRDDFTPMGEMTGGQAPAAIWREIMERALIVRPPPRAAPPALAPAVAG